ncbi:MAG TPA: hypothetical protein VEU98_10465 [Candidatus Eremiobacteraceae bacterium]|nr:hypothetical protein [Candidatus Eremiobacteraceae bacterium]
MGRMLSALLICSLLVCAPLRADDSNTGDAGAKPAAPATTDKSASTNAAKTEANKNEAGKPATDYREEIEELRQLMREQAQQLGEQQKQLELLRAQLAATTKAATSSAPAAAPGAEPATVHVVSGDVGYAVRPTGGPAATAAPADEKKKEEEGPSTIRYKGVNITPGGFIEAATVSRQRAASADINTPFTGIPYPGLALGKVSENNFSARQSRLSLLIDTKVGSAKVSGYFEGDWLGAGVTSNNRQSNSYVFRQRQLWASVKFDSGAYFAGGQMWSLVTESKKGIENRQEAFPLQIDPQYIVGWAWQRAYGFRVAKNWDKFAIGAGIEAPQTTLGGRGFPLNFFIDAPGAGGGLYNFVDTAGYTLNRAPDFLLKATADPGWGHYEVVGILSTFRNRIYPCGALPLPTFPTATCTTATSTAGAFNDSRTGGGVGATARLPVIAKKLDLVAHIQAGDGIGRYSSAQIADLTARPDGSISLIHSYAWLGSAEAHPNAKIDLYAYFGGEYGGRTAYNFTNGLGNPVPVGYGNPLFNNSGCSTETFPVPSGTGIGQPSSPTAPGAVGGCAGDVKQVLEGTLGFWHKIYNGPKGRLQWGVQYSYLTKYGWNGNNFNSTTGVAGPSLRPHAVDNMVLTSFRYYIP